MPNGTSAVAIVAGDASYTDQVNHLLVEGRTITDGDGQDHFDTFESRSR